ncbi:tetratricopeptide repeat protein [Myxococcaceae bacterium GXIMD 01537]
MLLASLAPGGALDAAEQAPLPEEEQAATISPCTPEQYVPPATDEQAERLRTSFLKDMQRAGWAGEYDVAVTLLCRAAAAGIGQAELLLGGLAQKGLYGVERDDNAARAWFERAAARGEVMAWTQLAHMYLEGEGGPALIPEGMALLRDAAEEGDAEAQLRLASEYAMGTHVPRDLDLAEQWAMRAREGGLKEASKVIELIQRFRGQ